MQRIQLSELEFTLLSSFNLCLLINGDRTKEESEECFKIILEGIKEDTPLHYYVSIVLSLINETFNSSVTDVLMKESNSNSQSFRELEKLLIARNMGLKSDNEMLQVTCKLFAQLINYLADGDINQIIEATDNIEALQDMLIRGGN